MNDGIRVWSGVGAVWIPIHPRLRYFPPKLGNGGGEFFTRQKTLKKAAPHDAGGGGG